MPKTRTQPRKSRRIALQELSTNASRPSTQHTADESDDSFSTSSSDDREDDLFELPTDEVDELDEVLINSWKSRQISLISSKLTIKKPLTQVLISMADGSPDSGNLPESPLWT
ncbi:hypothetical protein FOC4_g10011109 [Fusarium odoratissimum]|uniref:Uncharacterized protein n=2 Tax=Fusarium oxysporum species complex TaxID=171631 RepID=N1RLB7_FUSC4|nr:hypothetical protein FOC4_g10011109 [Fusarium odoratissimum]TXC09864.1 hypothetical protein FocTR4_00004939 [Fusarium oxysporum f. sp. cubense]